MHSNAAIPAIAGNSGLINKVARFHHCRNIQKLDINRVACIAHKILFVAKYLTSASKKYHFQEPAMFIRKILFIVLFLWGMTLTTSLAIASPQLSNEIPISVLNNVEYLPSVAYNSKHQEYLVVWHTTWIIGTRDIRAARVSQKGEVLATYTIYEHATKDSAQPSVAYDAVNDRYLVVWVFDAQGDNSDWDIYGRFIPWDGPSTGLTDFSICTWTTHQWVPKVIYSETQQEYLIVWNNEYQTGPSPMYISGRRINANDGSFPGGGGSDLTISHASQNRVNPDVTYNKASNEYLVVYDNGVDVFGMRLDSLASSLGVGEFTIAGWPGIEIHPSVASCKRANQYLVAWQSDQNSGDDAIYARFIAGSGTVGNVYQIDDTTSPEQEPNVTCNLYGTEYLITWQTRYVNVKYGIWGRLVQPSETMDPSFGIVPPGATSDRTNPVAAAGKAGYLVTWEHEREATSFQDIHGRLIQIPTFPWTMFLPAITNSAQN